MSLFPPMEPWSHIQGTRPICVWPFEHAPTELQKLSDFGGDEDWVALVPPELADTCIGWLEDGRGFGYRVGRYQLDGGWVVAIGAHA